jgi:hypothetical protein
MSNNLLPPADRKRGPRPRARAHRIRSERVVLALSLDRDDVRLLRAVLAVFRRREPRASALLERIGRAA